MTKIGLTQFLLLLLISAAYGQRVKYKDIYALLSTKQFEQAEPFLKAYLKENADNPNAYLFMANIYHEKSSNNDVLTQTTLALANMDSAIFFYDKAYKTIDDREVRKNKEYYQHYNRRDLRTGDFGIKLSDIQFDIEKRIQALKERVDRVKMTKHFFSLADSAYRRSNALYVSMQNNYASLNQLFLRSSEQTVKDLTTLSVRFDSCLKAFERYKGALATLGKTGYSQELSLTDIADFKTDGRSSANFLADEVKLWNYKKFADETRHVVEKEILPMRTHLVTYDTEISKLKQKLSTDSVSVRSDLTRLIDQLLYDQLTKFDESPLPMILFGMKTLDLEYRSLQIEHKPFRDSSDMHLHVRLLSDELSVLAKLDSTSAILSEEKLDEKTLDYEEFVANTYGSAAAVKRYIQDIRDFSAYQHKEKTAAIDRYRKALSYIVDGSDSIPLVHNSESVFRPLVVVAEKYTMGVSLQDTTQLKGYFYTITPSRTTEVKAYFPLDKSTFNTRTIENSGALTCSDAAGQIFYVLLYAGEAVKDKYPATLAKVYRSDGLAWKADYSLPFTPTDILLSQETGDLVIKNESNEFIVDKSGKMK